MSTFPDHIQISSDVTQRTNRSILLTYSAEGQNERESVCEEEQEICKANMC